MCFIGLVNSAISILQREHHFRKIVNILFFISIFDKSDSNSSLPCPETFKPNTFLKLCALMGFWHPILKTFVLQRFWAPTYCRTTGAMRGPGPTATTTTRLHIDLVQTLRRPHIAFVRLCAELTETSIPVNHSMNNSVKHWVNHSVNLSVKLSQPLSEPLSQPFSQALGQPFRQPLKRPLS